jgi:hypothetical protein
VEVSSVAGASHPLLSAAQRTRYAEPPLATTPVLDVDPQAVAKAQVALNRSDVLYL